MLEIDRGGENREVSRDGKAEKGQEEADWQNKKNAIDGRTEQVGIDARCPCLVMPGNACSSLVGFDQCEACYKDV